MAVASTGPERPDAAAAASSAPSPAVAPPPGNPRFALMDSVRGLALLFVIAFHVASLTGSLARPVLGDALTVLGPLAPPIFFALSGFLLYRPWVAARARTAPQPSTARYARRRALRILPAYWVALAVLGIFPAIAGVFGHGWWRYWFFLQLYDDDSLGRGIPVAWTLCVEATFYLLLPLWAAAARRARPRPGTELAVLAAVAVAGLAVQFAAARLDVSHLVASSLAGQCAWFALGMALALISVFAPPRDVPAGACWVGAAAAVAGVTALHLHSGGLFGLVAALQAPQPALRAAVGLVLSAAAIALLMLPSVFGSERGGWPRRLLAWGPLARLGVISYSVYLWHLTIAELLAMPAAPGHFSAHGLGLADSLPVPTVTLFAMTLAAAWAVAEVSYRLVELPFLRRKERA